MSAPPDDRLQPDLQLLSDACDAEARGFDDYVDRPFHDDDPGSAALASVSAAQEKLARDTPCNQATLTALHRRASGVDKPIALRDWPRLGKALGGGLWPGAYVVTAGTGFGKSQLCLQLSYRAACDGVPTIYIALELDDMGLDCRLLCMADRAAGGAPPWWSDLYTGRAGQDTLLLLIQQHAEELAKLPLYLKTDQGVQGWAYQQIRVAVKELRQAHPHAPTVLVVVDFLQLLVGTDDREDLRQRIGRAAYQARLVAREMGAAILLISATSRDNYGRLNVVLGTNGVPTVAPSSLVGAGKESGEIEYAADAALVLARASGDEAGNGCDSDAVWVAVAKSRVGGAGWYRLVERQGWFGEESEVGPKAESPTASGGGSGKRKSDRHAAKVATPGTPGGKSDHANPWDR